MAPRLSVVVRSYTDTLGGAHSTAAPSLLQDPVQLAGMSVALAMVTGAALWLSIRTWRKRRADQREREQAARIPRISLSKEKMMDTVTEKSSSGSHSPQRTPPGTLKFSPRLPKDTTRVQVVEAATGPPDETAARRESLPLRPIPRHIGRPRASATRSSMRPNSTVSFLSVPRPPPSPRRSSAYSSHRLSFASSASGPDESYQRRVWQRFHCQLPDELRVNVGERLIIVQVCNDGWCVAGRTSRSKPGEIELGTVPLWVFRKPVESVKFELRQRTSSLGVSVTLESPGGPSFSWSNA